MLKVVLLAACLFGFLVSVTPAASACCHLYEIRQSAGPCEFVATGEFVFGENRLDSASLWCTVAGEPYGAEYP